MNQNENKNNTLTSLQKCIHNIRNTRTLSVDDLIYINQLSFDERIQILTMK